MINMVLRVISSGKPVYISSAESPGLPDIARDKLLTDCAQWKVNLLSKSRSVLYWTACYFLLSQSKYSSWICQVESVQCYSACPLRRHIEWASLKLLKHIDQGENVFSRRMSTKISRVGNVHSKIFYSLETTDSPHNYVDVFDFATNANG